MKDKIDIAIIGGGIVGLAVAAEVSRKDRSVFLLEKNRSFGLEQSGRNSEVIHAGVYYPPDSLRTKFCREGNALIYEICARYGIGHLKCGKLHTATRNSQLSELEALYNSGVRNGANVRMLSRREVKRLEPEVECEAALLSPDTGVVDSYMLMKYLYAAAHREGLHIAYNSTVTSIKSVTNGYRVYIHGGEFLDSEVVINCAGLHGDEVSAMVGIDIDKHRYRLILYKGEYFSLGGDKAKSITRLVYPSSLDFRNGIHICYDINRRARLGPYFFQTNLIDYAVTGEHRQIFLDSPVMEALPFIHSEDLEPESSGIMVQRDAEAEADRDFIVRHEADRGLPGFIDVIGIGSPGLTSAPAIARYVRKIVTEILGS
jgi:L-2-hydroxyglutarate oxidase LhgO